MKPEQSSVSVVLVGSFAPADFGLEKFHLGRVLSESDLSETTIELLVPGQAETLQFPWGKFSVIGERLSVETTQVPYIRAADLILKLLAEVSPSSVALKVGINLAAHYRFGSASKRDDFATRLVPPTAWGSFGSEVSESFAQSSDRHGGLMKVTMRQARPDKRSAGWRDVTIEPSGLIPRDHGAVISVNDHYELSQDEVDTLKSPLAISSRILETVGQVFDASIERSFVICDELTRDFS